MFTVKEKIKENLLNRKKTIEAALEEGFTPPNVRAAKRSAIIEAASRMKIPERTMRETDKQLKKNDLDPIDWGKYKIDESAEQQAESDNVVEKTKIDILSKQVKTLREELTKYVHIDQIMKDLDRQNVSPPKWHKELSTNLRHTPKLPVFLTSDAQVGEVIKEEVLGYPNSYNPDIYIERMKKYADKCMDIARTDYRPYKFPGAILWRGGDTINNNWLEEWLATQSLEVPEQCTLACETEIALIETLLEEKDEDGEYRFPHITIYVTSGNHDRNTHKTQDKRYVLSSWEHCITWFIAKYFASNDRVDLVEPKTGEALVDIWGHKALFMHGDRIGSRGGSGFIGAEATILRGVHKLRKQYASFGTPFDNLFLGHWHISRRVGQGCIVNGSVVGYNEFAKNTMRVEPELASQAFCLFSADYGLVDHKTIYLQDPFKADQMPNYSVWY